MRPINEPKGVRKPHPSLWIGGEGEKVTLKLVAQYGDASNFGNGDPEIIRQKCDVLKRHCDALGRDYDEIIKSTEINCVLLDGESDRERVIAPIRELVGMSEDEFRDNYLGGDVGGDRGAATTGDRRRDRLRHPLHAQARLRPSASSAIRE